MNLIAEQTTDTLTIWIPGAVAINQSGAPAKRPMSAAFGHWWADALKQVIEQRQGFQETFPIRKAKVTITFVGQHQGSIVSLLQSVVKLLTYVDCSKRPTIRGYHMKLEDYPGLTVQHQSGTEDETGLRIEIQPIEE